MKAVEAEKSTDFDIAGSIEAIEIQSQLIVKYNDEIRTLKCQVEVLSLFKAELLNATSRNIEKTSESTRAINFFNIGPLPAQDSGLSAQLLNTSFSTEVKRNFETQPTWDFSLFESIITEAKPKKSVFDNAEGFAKGCCYDSSIVYEDSVIRVGFRLIATVAASETAWVYIENQSQTELTNIAYQLTQPQGFNTSINLIDQKGETLAKPKARHRNFLQVD